MSQNESRKKDESESLAADGGLLVAAVHSPSEERHDQEDRNGVLLHARPTVLARVSFLDRKGNEERKFGSELFWASEAPEASNRALLDGTVVSGCTVVQSSRSLCSQSRKNESSIQADPVHLRGPRWPLRPALRSGASVGAVQRKARFVFRNS